MNWQANHVYYQDGPTWWGYAYVTGQHGDQLSVMTAEYRDGRFLDVGMLQSVSLDFAQEHWRQLTDDERAGKLSFIGYRDA